MIRSYRITDAARQFLSGRLEARDLARPRASLGFPPRLLTRTEAARCALPAARMGRAFGAFERGRLEALAALQARRGASAWEVTGLFASPIGYIELEELLAGAAAAIGELGVERLFLRLEAESPVAGPSQRAGFRVAFSEELLTGTLRPPAEERTMILRPFRREDANEVFRLQVATAPIAARPAIGLTLSEWDASKEDAEGEATREFVCDTEQGLSAWVRIDRGERGVTVEAMLHPDRADLAEPLIESAALALGRESEARWIVPTHQPHLAKALADRGWRTRAEYAVSLKPVARHARQPAMTPAQA